MFSGAICLMIVLTVIVCQVLTGSAKVIALIVLGLGTLCMMLDARNLEKATLDIKKLKETNNEKTE